MIQSIFYTLSTLASVFSLICLVRIVLTWAPNLEYSTAGRFLARLCDPYLNWFRRFSFTRIGPADFSPILALGTLSVATMVLSSIAATGRISLLVVAFALFQVIWSFVSFILSILVIFLFIRLIYDLVNRYGYSPFWTMLDRFLNPVISRVSGFFSYIFSRTKPFRYRVSLLLTLLTVLALRIALSFGVGYLYSLVMTQPV
ncbi:MAG: YggT family protein [Treponema sp.]|nr:YggT family protein [Treponema sp.]